MPKLVNSSWFVVSSHKKTTNHQPATTNKRRRRFGFSLIELLIVIALIGILSSIVTVGMTSAQRKARDGQRKSDLAQVKRALESAKADCKNAAYYPAFAISGTSAVTSYNNLMTYLTDADLKYLPSIINNSGGGVGNYLFNVTPTIASKCPGNVANPTLSEFGTENIALRAQLENQNDPDLKSSYAKCSTAPVNWQLLPNPPTDTVPPIGVDDNFYYYVCND